MKNATDVSASAQAADLVSRMPHLRGPGSGAFWRHGTARITRPTEAEGRKSTLPGQKLLYICSLGRAPLQLHAQHFVVGRLDRPCPGSGCLGGAARTVKQVGMRGVQRGVAVKLARGQHW